MKNVLVADIMTRDPITISPDTNLLDCAKRMIKKHVGSLVIVEKRRLVGFLSEKDILWALVKKSKEDLSRIRAIEISPRKIAVIKPTNTIKEAVEKMKKMKFEKLPVIDKNELVGMITIKDILNFNPELYPELEEFSQIREESSKLKNVKKAEKRIIGVCEECGTENVLSRENGILLCESCRDAI